MITFSYTITDELGIHARPAGALAKTAKNFKSQITLQKGEKSCDARKVMMLMSLGIKNGDTITVSVSGEDETDAAEAVQKLLNENL